MFLRMDPRSWRDPELEIYYKNWSFIHRTCYSLVFPRILEFEKKNKNLEMTNMQAPDT